MSERLDRAVVEAILDAPLKEFRPKPLFYGPPEFAPAFFERARREYAKLATPSHKDGR